MPTKRAAGVGSGGRVASGGRRAARHEGRARPASRPRGPVQLRQAERKDYRFEIQEKQGTVSVVGPRGTLAYPRFWVGVELAQGEVFTSCQSGFSAGAGVWVSEVANGRLVLELSLKRSSAPSGALIRAAVRNRGSDPIAIRGIRVAHAVTGVESTPWGPVGGWSLLRMGYTYGGAHREDGDARNSARITFADDRVVTRSWGAAALRFGASPRGLVAGFTTGDSQMAWIDVRRDRHTVELAAICETEGGVLLPGRVVSSETLYLGVHDDVRAGLAEYGAFCGRRAGTVLRPVPAGWSTRGSLGRADLSEAAVLRQARSLASRRRSLPLSVVLVDEGWAKTLGDWDRPGERFPRGMPPLAAEISADGLVPGLWMAPLAASSSSRLFHDHPDWMVKDETGRPLAWDAGGPETPEILHGLDGSHPEVLEWLRELFASLRRAGFRYFVLDRLYLGAIKGMRAEPVTRVQAFRRALEAIRQGAGDAYLVGAEAPYAPCAGVLDGMRVCRAPAPGAAFAETASAAMQEVHQRWWTHRGMWNNDPGPVSAEGGGAAASGAEASLMASTELSGGSLFVEDRLDDMPADRAGLLAEALARRRDAPAVPIDVFDRDVPRVISLPLGHRRFRVGVFNDTDSPRAFAIDLDGFGCARARIWELAGADRRPLGVVRRRFLTPPVPGRGVRVLLIEGA